MTTNLADLIRNIPDFPIPGIQFKDITPLLQNGAAFKEVIDTLAARYEGRALDAIVGIESRGFIFSAPLAYRLGVGMIPIRKPGIFRQDTTCPALLIELTACAFLCTGLSPCIARLSRRFH